MIKSRFMQEISGDLGEFWMNHAQEELDKISNELRDGSITIDKNGVAYNRIGRVVMNDMLEKIAYVTDEVDVEATKAARREEVSREIADYRRNYTGPSEEELAEMKNEFGPGEKVVNILTGELITL